MADEEQVRAPTPEEKYAPKLPKQVQDQVDAVNRAITQLDAEEQEQPDQQEDDNDEPDAGDDDLGQPPDQQFQQPQQEESWEQRARSTAGRLQQSLDANTQMAKRLGDLERELNLMRVNGATPAQAPIPKAPQKLIKPEELSDYGEEFFDVVGRRAKEELLPIVETFDERIEAPGDPASRRRQGRRTRRRSEVLYDTLRDEVPEWSEINHHPAFHELASDSRPLQRSAA